MTGQDPNVCCHLGAAGRNAFSGGNNTPVLAPRMRSVRAVGVRCVVRAALVSCCERGVGSSGSIGKAPRRTGSDASRGGKDAGFEPIAVVDDAVTDDEPKGSVVEETVFGDAVWLVCMPSDARSGRSTLGPVPLYRSQ